LAAHFLELYVARLSRPQLALSERAYAALCRHTWPGNIRELENVIHNAVLLAAGPLIEPEDLRLDSATRPLAGRPRAVGEGLAPLIERAMGGGEPDLSERVTGTLVRTAFTASNANQVRAAERLGISRNAFRTHLARLGVIAARRRRPAEE